MAAEGRILIVTGETSGDRAAARVVTALRALRPGWRVEAVGGPELRAAGAEILAPSDELSVMGFAEVVGRLPALRRRLGQLGGRLDEHRYDLFLPVDAPAFNLRLAKRARRAGVPVLYFIAPQVWAWGQGRVRDLRRLLSGLAVILPFEEAWFGREGVACRFVGHPIMEEAPPWGPPQAALRLGLLPGSRLQEVRRHLPLMLAAAARLQASWPGLACELLESPALAPALYDDLLAGARPAPRRRREPSATFLADQRAVLVASGTATLEAAVAGVPMAVLYRTGRLNYWLARRLVRLQRIALVNLVAGREVVPEFVQGAVQPERVAEALATILPDGPAREKQRDAFLELRRALGTPGCGERVARMAIEILEGP